MSDTLTSKSKSFKIIVSYLLLLANKTPYQENVRVFLCIVQGKLFDELDDLHNNYPLAGEKIKVTEEMLSKYQLQIIEDYVFFLGKNKKCIPNLGNKRKYKHYYQNL